MACFANLVLHIIVDALCFILISLDLANLERKFLEELCDTESHAKSPDLLRIAILFKSL